ncbi:hypothetical protein BH09SUM1_BH09SUM1_28930 [soil metagenome]
MLALPHYMPLVPVGARWEIAIVPWLWIVPLSAIIRRKVRSWLYLAISVLIGCTLVDIVIGYPFTLMWTTACAMVLEGVIIALNPDR